VADKTLQARNEAALEIEQVDDMDDKAVRAGDTAKQLQKFVLIDGDGGCFIIIFNTEAALTYGALLA